jgi:uncharacterized protein YndB with AHSA1/START domain
VIEKAFSIDIKAPITKVWDEITKTGSLQRAMYDTKLEIELRPGGKMRYRTANGKATPVWGEVVEVQKPTRLVHTFAFGGMEEAPTRVAWDLKEIPGGCRVTVTHSGFPGETKTLKSVSKVWPQILGRFKSVLETGNVPMGTRIGYAMMGAMSFMMPKAMRSDAVEKFIAERGWEKAKH